MEASMSFLEHVTMQYVDATHAALRDALCGLLTQLLNHMRSVWPHLSAHFSDAQL